MPEDRQSYQGFGFNGRCVGDVTVPRPVEPSDAPEGESDTFHEHQPVASETQGGGSALPIIAAVIGVVLLLGLVLAYVQGIIDPVLYNVGLNWETCGRSDGNIVCGHELRGGNDAVVESVKAGVKGWLW